MRPSDVESPMWTTDLQIVLFGLTCTFFTFFVLAITSFDGGLDPTPAPAIPARALTVTKPAAATTTHARRGGTPPWARVRSRIRSRILRSPPWRIGSSMYFHDSAATRKVAAT